jgi:hypothetical protein
MSGFVEQETGRSPRSAELLAGRELAGKHGRYWLVFDLGRLRGKPLSTVPTGTLARRPSWQTIVARPMRIVTGLVQERRPISALAPRRSGATSRRVSQVRRAPDGRCTDRRLATDRRPGLQRCFTVRPAFRQYRPIVNPGYIPRWRRYAKTSVRRPVGVAETSSRSSPLTAGPRPAGRTSRFSCRASILCIDHYRRRRGGQGELSFLFDLARVSRKGWVARCGRRWLSGSTPVGRLE